MKTYAKNIRPYNLVSHEIWKMDLSERDTCLKLDWNEAAITPSPMVVQKIRELAEDASFYQWYPSTDDSVLNEAIAEYLQVSSNNILTFASSDTLHENVVKTWVEEKSKVIILWPTYDNFRLTVAGTGAEIIYHEMDELKYGQGAFINRLSQDKIDMAYICNPNNPTGEQIAIEDIERMLKAYPNTVFLVDEAYAEFSGKTCVGLVENYPNLIISRTFSKAFGLANFRIGYAVSCKNNIEMLKKFRNPKNISTFSQEAALAALKDLNYMYSYVEEVKEAKRFFYAEAEENVLPMKLYESSANFIMMSFENEVEKDEFIKYLEMRKIFVRNLEYCDSLKRMIRITVGTLKQMKYLAEVVKEYMRVKNESGSF